MIGVCDETVNVDSCDQYEREHDGPEPECVRAVLERSPNEFGPTVLAAYERMIAAFPAESESAKVARFGTWARKKGKPLCLYVIALVYELRWDGESDAKLNGEVAGPFALSGRWVAVMLGKYGIRPDMTFCTRTKVAYDVLAAMQTVGLLVRTSEYRYAEHLAREFTARTVAELEAVPAPVVVSQPETPVADVVAQVWRDVSADEGRDNEERYACAVAALEAHATHEPAGTKRRREFARVIDEFRAAHFTLRRERDKAEDAIRCRPPARRGKKGAPLARCET
jgi:hypothetical protein